MPPVVRMDTMVFADAATDTCDRQARALADGAVGRDVGDGGRMRRLVPVLPEGGLRRWRHCRRAPRTDVQGVRQTVAAPGR